MCTDYTLNRPLVDKSAAVHLMVQNARLLQTDFLRFVDLDDIAILDNDMDIPVADGLDRIHDLLNRDAAMYGLVRTTAWHVGSALQCHPGPS